MQRKTRRQSRNSDTAAIVAKKYLGQHFLTSKSALFEMIRAAGVTKDDTVVEIGPGTGLLTEQLLGTGARVYAIEKDDDLLPLLRTTFAKEIESQQLILIKGDVRTTRAEELVGNTSYKIVANIPYYITGEIIRDAFEATHQPTSITLLVQKEVAERIVRSKKESILSLSVKIYGTPSYIKTVPRGSFSPPPTVDSAIIHIQAISRDRLKDITADEYFKVVKCAFKARRKMLVGNLKSLYPQTKIEEACTAAGISIAARAEDVHPLQWVSLVASLGRTDKQHEEPRIHNKRKH